MKAAVTLAVQKAIEIIPNVGAAILPDAYDASKITFTGAGYAHDSIRDMTGLSANDAILIASHVLGRAALWAKRKITGNPEARLSHDDAPDVGAHADAVIGLLDDIGKRLGLTGYKLPDREELMVKIAERTGKPGA